MNRAKVVSASDVLAEAASDVHGNCSKAVLHQVPESETSLFSVKVGGAADVWPLASRAKPRAIL